MRADLPYTRIITRTRDKIIFMKSVLSFIGGSDRPDAPEEQIGTKNRNKKKKKNGKFIDFGFRAQPRCVHNGFTVPMHDV